MAGKLYDIVSAEQGPGRSINLTINVNPYLMKNPFSQDVINQLFPAGYKVSFDGNALRVYNPEDGDKEKPYFELTP